jgi:tRNA pseudouridine55 synthase
LSKGTYVRKLAEDIGEKLGCGAHIIKIKRLSIGRFKLEDAVKLDDINESHLQKTTL